jgi:hypothetical protein
MNQSVRRMDPLRKNLDTYNPDSSMPPHPIEQQSNPPRHQLSLWRHSLKREYLPRGKQTRPIPPDKKRKLIRKLLCSTKIGTNNNPDSPLPQKLSHPPSTRRSLKARTDNGLFCWHGVVGTEGDFARLGGFVVSDGTYTTVLSVVTEGFGVSIEHYIART